MEIKRDRYPEEMKKAIGNQMVKIITGPRRCGKSYLLFKIFRDWLREQGVDDSHIIKLKLDDARNVLYRNPLAMAEYFRKRKPNDGKTSFFIIDEIQLCESIPNPAFEGIRTADGSTPTVTFYDVLNEFLHYEDTEVFVTGSNSKMLSSDIATEFRGRSWQIHMHSLSYFEFLSAHQGEGDDLTLWDQYLYYGGLPMVSLLQDDAAKRSYLEDVYRTIYLKDLVERHSLKGDVAIGELASFLASTVGSPVNPANISGALLSKEGVKVSQPTIKLYLAYLQDAFLVSEASRFNLRGKEKFGSGAKYYFEDLGLRNAANSFIDYDQEPHCMENVIYNELVNRGYKVSIGSVADYVKNNDRTERRNYEVDFIADKGGKRIYIQSALYIPDKTKMDQERRPLLLIGDSFQKVIITKVSGTGMYDEDGIRHLNLFRFLKDADSLQD